MDPITLTLAGAGLAQSLYGGWKAGQERKKMDRKIGQLETENQAYYNANALGDYTQRSDAQNALGQMRNQLDRQTKRATNTAVITGATPEATALAKQGANEALAGATSNIAAVGQQFKDRVTDRYMNRKDRYGMMRLQQSEGAAQGYEGLMQSGLNTMAGSLSTVSAAPKAPNAPGPVAPVSTIAKTTDPLKNLGGIIPKYERQF